MRACAVLFGSICFMGLLGISWAQQDAGDLLLRAHMLSAEGGWHEALDLYVRARQEDTYNLQARIGVARAYFYLNRQPAALRAINAALRIATENREARLLAARIHGALNQVPQARQYVEPLLTATPRDPEVVLVAAEVEIVDGRLGSAEQLYQRLVDIEPANIDAQLALGLIARERGDIRRATAHIEEARRQEPTNAAPHFIAARHYAQIDDLINAEQAIILANQLAPLNRESMLLHAEIAMRIGQIELALQLSEALVTLDVLNPRYWLLRGLVLAHNGSYDDAVDSYIRALRIQSDYELARIAAENALRDYFPPTDSNRLAFAADRFELAAAAARTIDSARARLRSIVVDYNWRRLIPMRGARMRACCRVRGYQPNICKS